MYTLKGIFPEPKKEQKKNFIRENMKQLKSIQGKSPKEPKYTMKAVHPPHLTNSVAPGTSATRVKSSPSTKSTKISLAVGKTSSTKHPEVRIKKGDMAEFLKRKEMRQLKPEVASAESVDCSSTESSGRLRDIGCQTIESNLAKKFAEGVKLSEKPKDGSDSKVKASGDSRQHRNPPSQSPRNAGDEAIKAENKHSRLNSILERKDKDSHISSGEQKPPAPQYVAGAAGGAEHCPPGHVELPEHERRETLTMLRNSFAELVSELNKLPVKTDTLRARRRKAELEARLATLEDGLRVFTRPRVYVNVNH